MTVTAVITLKTATTGLSVTAVTVIPGSVQGTPISESDSTAESPRNSATCGENGRPGRGLTCCASSRQTVTIVPMVTHGASSLGLLRAAAPS